MKYSEKIEAALVAQIEREPERPVILAPRHYWKGQSQPIVYIDGMPTPLIRHLHNILIAPLSEEEGIANPPDVEAGNVNPHLAVILPTRGSRPACINGHPYSEEDYVPGVGHRCRQCREMKRIGTPQIADVNRAKTECPRGHPYSPKNTRITKDGRRRCKQCARDQTAAWRERSQA